MDSHGNLVKGRFIVKVPYCADHIKPVRTFTLIDSLAVIAGALLGIGLTFFLVSDFFSGTPLILAYILIPLFAASLFFAVGVGIKSLLPKLSPKLKDYASHKGHYGICSHGVRVDGGEEMKGPITYWLKLAFCQPEMAKRFLAAAPKAQVVRGKRFLD